MEGYTMQQSPNLRQGQKLVTIISSANVLHRLLRLSLPKSLELQSSGYNSARLVCSLLCALHGVHFNNSLELSRNIHTVDDKEANSHVCI
ncbi:hypothetical protein C0J52_00725 [Blattella germanica]|nr:hypothetical protein C0J52_00725 [Blattella germanica]